MKGSIEKIFFFIKILQGSLNNLEDETNNLNIAIDNKSCSIEELEKELIQLKEIQKLFSNSSSNASEICEARHLIELRILDLEVIIKTQSLHRKLLLKMKKAK